MSILPGWNSLETVTRLTKFFTVSGFLSLFLLGAFEILAYIYGNRKDALIAGNQAAIDAVRSKQEEQQRKDNEASMEQVKRELREAQQQGVQTSEQLAQIESKSIEFGEKNRRPKHYARTTNDIEYGVVRESKVRNYYYL